MTLGKTVSDRKVPADQVTAFTRTICKVGTSAYMCVPKRLCRAINLLPGDIVTVVQTSEAGFAVVKVAHGARHEQSAVGAVGAD